MSTTSSKPKERDKLETLLDTRTEGNRVKVMTKALKIALEYKNTNGSSADTLVTAIEIEIDNWVVQSDAYLDTVKVNDQSVWE